MKSLISLFNHENIVRYTARLLLDSHQLLIQGVSIEMSSNTTIAGTFLLKHPVWFVCLAVNVILLRQDYHLHTNASFHKSNCIKNSLNMLSLSYYVCCLTNYRTYKSRIQQKDYLTLKGSIYVCPSVCLIVSLSAMKTRTND